MNFIIMRQGITEYCRVGKYMRLSDRKRSDGREWRRQRERDEKKKRKKKEKSKSKEGREREKEAQIRIRLPKQATVQQKAIRRVKLNLARGRCI